jgi:RNA polymerase sigma-70 factor (ECF subfamily)
MDLAITPTDDELLRLMMAGDEEAFTLLYRRRQGGLYRFALHMSGSQAVAEDVTQEVFMTLMREAENYDPARGSLAAYLYGIARNFVLRRLQKDRCYVSIIEASEDADTSDLDCLVAEGDPLGDLTRNETIEAVRQAVLALPAHYREAIVLCDLHEMSYADAAAALGCAVGTIRSRLHRARAMLIEKLRARGHVDSATNMVSSTRCFA